MQWRPQRGGAMSLSLIDRVEACCALTRGEAEALMEEILSGRMATPEIVRLLMALNRRTLEVQELAGFARVMRKHVTRGPQTWSIRVGRVVTARRHLTSQPRRRLWRRRPVRAWRSTETARQARRAGRQTCWKHSGCGLIYLLNDTGTRSATLELDFYSRRRRTRRRDMRLRHGNRLVCARCSIC